MEEKKTFEEILEEMKEAGVKESYADGKKDLEEIVAEAEEREAAEKAAAEVKAQAEAAAKKAAEMKERQEKPHGLVRTTVSAMPDPDSIPTESMEDYDDVLEASFKQIHVGDVLEGTVISVDETGVLLNLDYYAPGKVPADEMSADPHFSIMEDVQIGDRFAAIVTRRDDGAGNILLSRKQADDTLSWDKLKKLMEDKSVITGKITETVKAGAIMYVEGIRGFIPCSKLALEYVEDPTPYLNRIVDVQVINVDEASEKLVLSAKELLQGKAIEERNKKVSLLTVGNIVEGTVESIKDYGAFVNIGEGVSGLLHISQVSERRLKSLKGILKEGQTVKVLITKVDNGKVSLSMKALEDALNTEKSEEDVEEYNDHGSAGTSLGDLFKNLKF